MKFPVAIATLFLAATTALPAFAAMPTSASLHNATASVETVQYRQAPRQQRARQHAVQHSNGYNAYASHNRAPAAMTEPSRTIIPGWRCAYRDESSEYSAFPAWEICN
jgi:hypothetical protein